MLFQKHFVCFRVNDEKIKSVNTFDFKNFLGSAPHDLILDFLEAFWRDIKHVLPMFELN